MIQTGVPKLSYGINSQLLIRGISMETKGKTMANDEADYKPVSEPGGSQSKRFLDVGVKASLQFEMSSMMSLVVQINFLSYSYRNRHSSVQFSRSACPTLCDPMNRSTPGLPVHHQLPEFTQTHIHRVGDAIQPSHPLSPPSPPAPNRSQHQSLFQ